MWKRVGILGAGESGIGAALLAKKIGAEVLVSDGGEIKDRFRSELETNSIPFETGEHKRISFFEPDVVIKSPGIPERASIVQKMRQAGLPVISEIEYAFRYSGKTIIAVTGSNGKTTTTALIGALLQSAGVQVQVGGNIGYSFARLVAAEKGDVYVLEISSFQLDDIQQFRPDIALLLNITADHLDRYHYRIEDYGKAKFRITENQQATDTFIYNLDDPHSMNLMKEHQIRARKLAFSHQRHSSSSAWTEGEQLILEGTPWENFSETRLLGQHNQLNVLAALLAVQAYGIKDPVLIQGGLRRFQAIEHRLEKVVEEEGVLYINDSKATNVDAVYYALKGMDRPIIWLAGGVDKGNDYSMIHDLVKAKVKAIVILGAQREKFDSDFPEIPRSQWESMAAAVKHAVKLAEKGDVILLSPACASFDLFQNYEDRGRQFKQYVKENVKKC